MSPDEVETKDSLSEAVGSIETAAAVDRRAFRIRSGMVGAVAVGFMLATLTAGSASAVQKQIIRPPGTTPGGNYSPGILVDGTLYISGQAGEDKNGKIPASFEAEVKQALDNIDVVLKAAGLTSSDVVSVQAYLTDGALFQPFNAVYTAYFKDPRPTRTTVVVAKLVGDGHIEITVTAKK